MYVLVDEVIVVTANEEMILREAVASVCATGGRMYAPKILT